MGTQTSSFGVSKRESHDSSLFYGRKLMEVQEDLKSLPQAASEESIDALFCQSAVDMSQVADDSVALMVTSPPYHVGKDKYDTDHTLEEFLGGTILPVLEDVFRTLQPGGRAAINVAGLGRKPYLNFPNVIDQIMLGIGYLPRGEIIWVKGKGASGSCAWGSWLSPSNPTLRDLHEKVLLYSKGRFDRHPKIRGARRPEKDKEAFMRDTLSIWEIPPESAKRVGHPAPFPVELPKRLIELYTYPGELVLDPFIGAGATAVAAKKTGRRYVGYDIFAEYLALARDRLEQE